MRKLGISYKICLVKFGAHCSTAGGVWKALQRAKEIKAEICQVFVKNNMQWFGKSYSPQDLALYANELAANRFACVFGHTGYLINLGAPPSANRDHSIKALVQEIQFATQLGLPFLVLHPGAHLGTGEENGLKQIVAGLDQVFAATKASPVRIALENTAGQGTCLGNKIAHLAAIYDRVKEPERLGVCLDTAHFFAAGYDIRTPKGWNAAIREVVSLIGPETNPLLSLKRLKDRFWFAGGPARPHRAREDWAGSIPAHRQRCAVQTCPGCIETPKSEGLQEDKANLATLRALVK